MQLRFSWIRKAAFVCPVRPAPRTAVLVAGFRSRSSVRVFPEGWGKRAEKFAPGSVAATLAQLDALIEAKISLTHSIIVLGREAAPRITAPDRDRLWRAFAVPVFEQIIDETCELLAFECEAHDGLHIVSPNLIVAPEDVVTAVCGCGRTSPRLISQARRIAAAAR